MLILALSFVFYAKGFGQAPIVGTVNPTGGHSTYTIAIPPFTVKGGQQLATPMEKIIMNDLVLSGYFNPLKPEQFVVDTHQLDLARNSIQFAEWRRVGALYLLKGEYEVVGGALVVKFWLYDTAGSAGYIFGRGYDKTYTVNDERKQAHTISDDIIRQVTGEPGIAGTQICYVRNNDAYGKSKQVCVIDADGANAHPIIPGDSLVAAPCWGANGTEIYYTTWREFNPDLEGVLLRSGKRWWISRFVNLNYSPDWSEKQQLIALSLSKDGNPELYTMNRRGLELRRLTNDRAIDGQPCWSPDGSQICFTSDRAAGKQLYILDVRTLETRRLTYNESSDNDGASWAANGTKKIAFMSLINGTYQVCTINPDGSDFKQLSTGGSRCEDPSWAPNGRVMVFTSNRSGENQLYSMYSDGSNQHQLTSGVPCHSSRWSPAMQ